MTDEGTQQAPAEPAEISDESLETVSGGSMPSLIWPFINLPLQPPMPTGPTFPIPTTESV